MQGSLSLLRISENCNNDNSDGNLYVFDYDNTNDYVYMITVMKIMHDFC